MSFYQSLFPRFHDLTPAQAEKAIREAAVLEGASQDTAVIEYQAARLSYAALSLHGQPVSPETLHKVGVALAAGVRIEVVSSPQGPVFQVGGSPQPLTPVGPVTRKQYDYFHGGKKVTGALAKFIRTNFPNSKAAAILAHPGHSAKSVVGAWEAVERDAALRDKFSRRQQRRDLAAAG